MNSMPIFTLVRKARDLVSMRGQLHFCLLFVFGCFTALLEMASIGLIVPTLVSLSGGGADFPLIKDLGLHRYSDAMVSTVAIMFGLLALAFLLKNVLVAIYVYVVSAGLFKIKADLEISTLQHFYALDYEQVSYQDGADVIRLLLIECRLLYDYFLYPALTILVEFVVIVLLATLVVSITPAGAWVGIAFLGVGVAVVGLLSSRRIGKLAKRRIERDQQKVKSAKEGVNGIRDALIFRRQKQMVLEFQKSSIDVARVEGEFAFFTQLSRPLLESFGVIGVFLLVLMLTLAGNEQSAVIATVGLFAAVGFRLLPSGTRILQAYQSLKFAGPTVNTLHDFHLKKSWQPAREPIELGLWDKLEFRGLSFHYRHGAGSTLKDASFTIESGKWTALIGPSGSGKSTVANVFLGLLTPQMGRVILGEQTIDLTKNCIRSNFGYVPQSVYLFDDTIRANIVFGRGDAPGNPEHLEDVVDAAGLKDFISNLSGGLDYGVGENGARLSGGQRQRIGVARALYGSPSVLVLDESTSALDEQIEIQILKRLKAKNPSLTVLLITHKTKLLEYCDNVIELQGQKVMQGGIVD